MDTYDDMIKANKEYVKQPPNKKYINSQYSRDHWTEHTKQEFLCFLFQYILMLTENIIKDQTDIPLLQSIIKVFTFLKMKVQFSGDELSKIV